MRSWDEVRGAWNGYWFAPAPYANLAICRIILVATQLMILGRLAPSLPGTANLEELYYDPLPLFRLFTFDASSPPSLTVVTIAFGVTVIAGVAALVGYKTNVSLSLFALGSLFLHGYHYSFSDFHHPETIMVLGLVALSLSPSGKALSVDRWTAERRGQRWGPSSTYAGWALRVIQWLLAIMYLDAAANKWYRAGFDWANGYTLRWSLYDHGVHRSSQLAIWIADSHFLSVVLSWVALLWETAFFLAVFSPLAAAIIIPFGLAIHIGMCLTHVACFYQFMAAYSAFVPWTKLGRSVGRSPAGKVLHHLGQRRATARSEQGG